MVQFPEAESEMGFWGVWLIEGVVFRKHSTVMREARICLKQSPGLVDPHGLLGHQSYSMSVHNLDAYINQPLALGHPQERETGVGTSVEMLGLECRSGVPKLAVKEEGCVWTLGSLSIWGVEKSYPRRPRRSGPRGGRRKSRRA